MGVVCMHVMLVLKRIEIPQIIKPLAGYRFGHRDEEEPTTLSPLLLWQLTPLARKFGVVSKAKPLSRVEDNVGATRLNLRHRLLRRKIERQHKVAGHDKGGTRATSLAVDVHAIPWPPT